MMLRSAFFARRAVLPLLAAVVCLRAAGDRMTVPARGMAFPATMPAVVLWAWEEPENLREVDTSRVGVAYLAETVELGGAEGLTVRLRHAPLTMAPGTAVMAVVRVEARAGLHDSEELRARTAAAIASAVWRPGVRALQVDFDARASERGFYAGVLGDLREELPPAVPLSITALVSWCEASPGWLRSLPVDEVVPMEFRLGGHAKPYAAKDGGALWDPVCERAVGVSTDESWPVQSGAAGAERIYLFSPAPWSGDQMAAAGGLSGLAARAAVLRVREAEVHGINDTGLPDERRAVQGNAGQEEP
jgi:hypothetical protein